MSRTIVGVFDDFTTANKVVKLLTDSGVARQDITIKSNEDSTTTTGGTSSHSGGGISGFFSSLFGSDADDHDTGYYSEAVRRGGAIVTVNADDSQADRVAQILDSNGAIDMDRRAAAYRASGFTGYDASAPPYSAEEATREREMYRADQGAVAIPVIEEELRVGKRAVQRGGVRIYNRVSERPVEETVTLREEHVNVQRRPVDRAVSDADVANLKDGVLEVTETAEEAVVSKQARVVEEVVVNKETVSHNETVRDTVRRTDVEVEEIDGTRARGKSST